MKRLRALFLDFDGLVLDTEDACFASWQWLFREHGHDYRLEDYLKIIGSDYDAHDPRTLLDQLTGRALDWAALEASRREAELRLGHGLTVKPGVREIVAEAEARELFRGVVSSATRQWVRGHLDRHGLLQSFHTLVCRDDVARIKPAPDLYLEAIRRAGINASEGIVLEDSHNGSLAAKDAGLWCVAVPNTITVTQDFSHADARVDNLASTTLAELAARCGLALEKKRAAGNE
ncbi:MAG: HAD family hydrolase [Opitutaceae bacterium]